MGSGCPTPRDAERAPVGANTAECECDGNIPAPRACAAKSSSGLFPIPAPPPPPPPPPLPPPPPPSPPPLPPPAPAPDLNPNPRPDPIPRPRALVVIMGGCPRVCLYHSSSSTYSSSRPVRDTTSFSPKSPTSKSAIISESSLIRDSRALTCELRRFSLPPWKLPPVPPAPPVPSLPLRLRFSPEPLLLCSDAPVPVTSLLLAPLQPASNGWKRVTAAAAAAAAAAGSNGGRISLNWICVGASRATVGGSCRRGWCLAVLCCCRERG
ncbi:unnamed protein product [Closterium sp. NIES-54]